MIINNPMVVSNALVSVMMPEDAINKCKNKGIEREAFTEAFKRRVYCVFCINTSVVEFY